MSMNVRACDWQITQLELKSNKPKFKYWSKLKYLTNKCI